MYIVKKLPNKVGLRLEVGDFTSEVGERRSREIHSNLTPVLLPFSFVRAVDHSKLATPVRF